MESTIADCAVSFSDGASDGLEEVGGAVGVGSVRRVEVWYAMNLRKEVARLSMASWLLYNWVRGCGNFGGENRGGKR